MGHPEADHASPTGAPAPARVEPYGQQAEWAAPATAERPPQNTPVWMDVAPAAPEVRRGVAPMPRSGLSTLFFFALIVVAVGAAGIGGVAMWGPEKTIKNRTQFATNPPAPTVLPSLPSAEAAPAPDPPTAPEAAPPAEEPAPAAVAQAAASKSKRAPKVAPKLSKKKKRR